jgi:hypothetical protein
LEPESFSSITEFGVAIAGFSGVAVALTHRDGGMSPIDRFRTLNLLVSALGATFASTFPLAAASFGATGSVIWAASSAGFAALLLVNSFLPFVLAASLSPEDRAALSSVIWMLAGGGSAVMVIWQATNAYAVFGPASPGPFVAGLLWQLFTATLLFVRLLVKRTVQADASS